MQHPSRRDLLLASLSALAFPNTLLAQSKPRIGILSALPRDRSVVTPHLVKALAARGLQEGKTLELLFRSVDGQLDRYGVLARELVEAKCDVIFPLASLQSARAMSAIRTTVPVVLLTLEYDPLEAGIVKSLARPGGNITGVFAPAVALMAKNLELVRELLPHAKRILVFSDPIARPQLPALKAAADRTGVSLSVVEFDKPPYDLSSVAEAIRRDKPGAAILPSSAGFVAVRKGLSAFIVENGIAAIVPPFMAADAGSLASYGVDLSQVAGRAARMAERILKGAKPGDLPIEQVDEFSLTINMRTAKALGIKVPYSVMARATNVLE
jgi:putative ABC transport system substrate-binding protein